MMKLATYNVENLFQRARALSAASWAEGRVVLQQHAAMNRILNKPKYSAADKKRLVSLCRTLGLEKRDDGGAFVILRQNKGKLLRRPKAGGLEIVAGGRGDWVGWLDLKLGDIDDTATRNTARVVRDVGADVLAVIEVESRPALVRFSEDVLPAVEGEPYRHVMLIDGNDERGIDVGIMLRDGFEITGMRSHVDDADAEGRIFSRDCAEYRIRTPRGAEVVVLVNHFKSKGFGAARETAERRRRQAVRVGEIYQELVQSGARLVAVVGDLNDVPGSEALRPLIEGTDLRDVSGHEAFDDGGRIGTFGNGAPGEKIDYLLLSPELMRRVRRGGVFRMGVWGGKAGELFRHYEEIGAPGEAASDHAAVWCEVAV